MIQRARVRDMPDVLQSQTNGAHSTAWVSPGRTLSQSSMADKKPTTEEILARLRKQDAGGGSASTSSASHGDAPTEEATTATPPSAATSPAEQPPSAAPPTAKPVSTADILAAARGQGSGKSVPTGAETPAAPTKPPAGSAAKPGSTSDILAAARAQGAREKPAVGAPSKPGSTADILAAARAQRAPKSGGGAAEPATTSAAASKPGVKAVTAPVAGERPSVAEMVKAARQGSPMQSATAAPAKPRLPSKAAPVPKRGPEETGRRSFMATAITTVFTPYYLAWTVLGIIGGIWSLAVARFMMPNMIVEPPMRFKIGTLSDYPAGTVSEKWKAERGIWIVNTDSYDGRSLVYALASVCTHLGCTPNWLEGEQKFKCPCHGSGFYINGINFEGPAPRPLERVGLRLAEDGSLEVDKSLKFQEELGQWQDPASYVELT